MSDDNNGKFNLSRRKALAGIGAAGAAVGIGGIGTVAQLTDTEGETATFTAGAIDGTIGYNLTYNGDTLESESDAGSNSLVTFEPQTTPEGVGAAVSFDDVKPGDYGTVNFTIEVENNPAWVASCLGSSSADGEVFEPEVEEDDDLDKSQIGDQGLTGGGELADNIYLIPFYDNNADSQFFDAGDAFSTQQTTSDAVSAPAGFWSNAQNAGDFSASAADSNEYIGPRQLSTIVTQKFDSTQTWSAPDLSFPTSDAPADTTLDDGCILLDGQVADDTSDNTQEATPLAPTETLNFGYDWHIPYTTGNEIMGDTLIVDVGFTFSQERHSAGPTMQNVYQPE